MKTIDYIGKYLGPNKIIDIQDSSGKENFMEVTFKGGEKKLTTKKGLESFTTDKSLDLTQFRNMRSEIIANELLLNVMEYDIKLGDLEHTMQTFADKIQDLFQRADSYLWTKDDKEWIPGREAINNRTLLEANRIITKIKDEKSK